MVNVTSDRIPWLAKGTPGYCLFSDPPKQPPVPKYVLAAEVSEEVSPERRVATRGTELFVGAGCEIRCVDLRDLKARFEEETGEDCNRNAKSSIERGYQVLDIPELDFNVQQLEVSPDGNYLAIVGEKRVAVCMLPAPGFARLSAEKLRSKCYQVGRTYHNDSAERIVRVIWHPFGVDGASLVILTSDAFVRVYDFTLHIQTTFEQADQTFNLNALSGRDRHKSSFTPDPEAFEPASCCFASGDSSWRPFTLYVLMRGGDIYSLCPIVPSRWMPSPGYLENLSRDLTMIMEALGTDATPSDRLMLRQQTKWLEDVLEQEASITEARRVSLSFGGQKKQDCFTRPESVGPSPILQGPFLLQPAPVDFSADEFYACDIIHILSDSIAIIAIVWSNGNIDILLEFEPITAKWLGKKQRQKKLAVGGSLPVIASFETVALNPPLPYNSARMNWPVFVENPLVSETIFVTHYAGVEAVDMSEWLKSLKIVLDQDEGEGFIAKMLQRAQSSSVQKVVNSGGTLPALPHPIVGCIVLQDSYVGYILLASSQTMLYTSDFDIPFQFKNSLEGNEGPPIQGKARRVSELPGYIASIAQPYYDPPAFLREPPAIFHFLIFQMGRCQPLMKGLIRYNAETLEILRQSRELVKRDYEKVATIADALYDRAKGQKAEYARQLITVQELVDKQKKLSNGDIKVRLEKVLKKQENLMKRADDIIGDLVRKGLGASGESGGVGLSEKERDWAQEVEKVEQRIHGPTGLVKRMERVEGVLDDLKPLVDNKEDSCAPASTLDDRNDGVPKELREKKIQELNEMLEKESFLVNTTKSKLERLESKVEELGLS